MSLGIPGKTVPACQPGPRGPAVVRPLAGPPAQRHAGVRFVASVGPPRFASALAHARAVRRSTNDPSLSPPVGAALSLHRPLSAILPGSQSAASQVYRQSWQPAVPELESGQDIPSGESHCAGTDLTAQTGQHLEKRTLSTSMLACPMGLLLAVVCQFAQDLAAFELVRKESASPCLNVTSYIGCHIQQIVPYRTQDPMPCVIWHWSNRLLLLIE